MGVDDIGPDGAFVAAALELAGSVCRGANVFVVVSLVVLAAAGAPVDPPRTEPSAEGPGEIVVTGERISRSLRETPSSVEVFTADMIENEPGADRLDQILEQIPNVQLGHGGQGPTIRGQDSTGVLQDLPAFLGGTKPRVTLQVDGRAVGYQEFTFGVAPLWDVQQIEVFRSPQTTTQGRNSIAGAIFVHTKDPTYSWEAGGRVLAGNYATRQLSAVASGPLVDQQLAFRLSADLRRSGTSVKFASRLRDADPNEDRFELIRFKLLAEPKALPGVRLEASYAHTQSRTPATEAVHAPFRDRRNPGTSPVFDTNVDALTGLVEIALNDTLATATTMSHGNSRSQRFATPGLGEAITRIRDWSIEPIIRWQPDGPIRLLGGVHHLRTQLDQVIDLTAVIGNGEFRDRQRSTGVFGEAAFKPMPRLSITAGIRYQTDSQVRRGQLGDAGFVLPIAFDESSSAWLPKMSVAYDLTTNLTAGLVVQRAYNPGGVALNFDTGQQEAFDVERLWSYELFARAAVANGRVRLSTNLFYNDYRDAQRARTRAFTVPGGATAFWAEIDNVPKAETYGLEASLDWQVSERLRVRSGIGLLRTKIVDAGRGGIAVDGNEFQRAPKLTGSASIDWRPLDRLRFNGSLRHNSPYYSDDANSPNRRIGKATKIDARASYEVGGVTLFGYARNLLDNFYMTYLFSRTVGTAGDPREVGIGLETKF